MRVASEPGSSAVPSVVLLGKGDLAIRIAEWYSRSAEHELVAVVPVMPEPAWCSSLSRWSAENNILSPTSGDYRDVLPLLESRPIDLAVSIFYDKILRSDFIESCGRVINLHNGPLPRYRGVSPINWALKNGEIEHGVTIHEITPGVDAGPVVAQVKFPINPEKDEVIDVYRRCLAFGWTLFEQVAPVLNDIMAVAQDESAVLHYTAQDDTRLGERRGFTRAAGAVPGD